MAERRSLRAADATTEAPSTVCALRLRGPLDETKLEAALAQLVASYESLRTRFPADAGQTHRVIDPVSAPVLERIRRTAEGPDAEATALGEAAERARRPFDRDQGAPFRAVLSRSSLRADEHVLWLAAAPVVADVRSLAVLARDVVHRYAALCGGPTSAATATAVEVQYADYAAWEYVTLRDGLSEPDIDSWAKAIADAPALLELPTDRARSAETSGPAGTHVLELDARLAEELRALSRREDVALSVVVRAALTVVLARLSGQKQVSVGLPIDNPERLDGLRDLVGPLQVIAPLVVDVSPTVTLRDLLGTVRSAMATVAERPCAALERALEQHSAKLGASHSLLRQVTLAVGRSPQLVERVGELTFELAEVPAVRTTSELDIFVDSEHPGLRTTTVYRADLFERRRVVEMMAQLAQVLRALTLSLDGRIDSVSLVTEQARAFLPDPAAIIDAPPQDTIAQTISSIATKSPDLPAIENGGTRWTYREFDSRAKAVAAALLRRNLPRGASVVVSGPRSTGVLAAWLGVWHAGGVAVPVADNLSVERKLVMARDANAVLAIVAGVDDTDWGFPVLPIDTASGHLVGVPTDETQSPVVLPELSGDDPMAIFFTSGTTGKPKGVLCNQKGPAHIMRWNRETFEIGAGDRAAQLIGLSFMAALRDTFSALAAGATLVLPSTDVTSLDGTAFFSWLREERITIMQAVPSLLETWTNAADDTPVPSLRILFTTGEPVNDALVRRCREIFPNARFISVYGMTETSRSCGYFEVPAEPRPGVQPLGKAVGATQLLLLNEAGVPAGVGEPGEVVVRSPFTSLGYIRDRSAGERAAGAPPEPYRQNPFRDDPRDLVVPTGDLGRFLLDGQVQIIGRVDDQVKINGVRVQPTEVATALRSHPAVDVAYVRHFKRPDGRAALCAYVVPARDARVTSDDLRRHVAGLLPSAFVPAVFVQLDKMPLNANGKIDRRALPEPSLETGEFVAPRTEMEARVAAVWAEVLRVEKIGVLDSFFALGGHSLLATRMQSRLSQAFAVPLTVRSLFEAPTVEQQVAAIVAMQSASKQGPQEVPLVPIDRAGSLPLSSAEGRLWFVEQYEPGTYNFALIMRVRGRIDPGALEGALTDLVRRQEVLRSRYLSNGGEPVRVIDPPRAVPLERLSLDPVEGGDDALLTQRLRREIGRPFDLEKGPLFRGALLALAPDEHVLLLSMHHIVSDGWSFDVLRNDLWALYAARVEGTPPALGELPIQYADYAAWQRSRLENGVLDRQVEYWRSHLADAPLMLELPTDRPRPAVQSTAGASYRFKLDRRLADGLRALARRESATMFMVFQAAFGAVLSRLSGQRSVVIGSPSVNRRRPELENLCGLFIDTLPFRVDASDNPTLVTLLRRVKSSVLGADEFSDVPFEKLVESLAPQRDMSRSPLCQVMLNILNIPRAESAVGGLAVERMSLPTSSVRFDVELYVNTDDPGLASLVTYRSHLFEHVRIVEMMEQLQLVLRAIVEQPDLRVDQCSLVTDRARALLPDPTIVLEAPPHEAASRTISRLATTAKDQPAIEGPGTRWTFGQLEHQSRTVAATLRKQGIRPGMTVVVSGPRSPALVAAMLGVWQTGGVIVPISDNMPEQRKLVMAREAEAAFAIVGGDEATRWAIPTLRVDSATGAIHGVDVDLSELPAELPEPAGDDPSYIFFTSGTTGKPKGVLGRHKGQSHFLRWQRETFGIGPSDRAAQLTGLSFDVLIRDMFTPISGGATLCFPPADAETIAGAALLTWLREARITVMHSVPSLLEAWLAHAGEVSPVTSLRLLFTAGEPLSDTLVSRCRTFFPNCRIVLLYGQTETTLAKTFFEVPAVPVPGVQPVGRPMPHAQTLVLNEAGVPCGIGEPGEIVMRTPFCSLGYLHGQSARKDSGEPVEPFRKNPFRNDPQDLVYRSGDLARFMLDGQLQILGRVDDQAKINGVRIQPAEVGAALRSHPLVDAVFVSVLKDAHGHQALCAYVVPARGAKVSVDELRTHISNLLPSAFVPAAFVLMDKLPLNSNGKVDRKALPEPNLAQAREYVAPRTVTEERVAAVWREVLRIDKVGIRSSFFELGGHSLLATQLQARLAQTFMVQLPLRAIFEAPTVEQQAARLVDLVGGEPSASAKPDLVRVDRSLPLPVSFTQQRFWFLDQLDGAGGTYNLTLARRLRGRLDRAALERSLEEIVRRHEVFRTTFEEGPDGLVQVIRSDMEAHLEWVDATGPDREAVAHAAVKHAARRSFDLSTGPIMCSTIVRVDEDEHLLVIVRHHIASDAWSLGVLWRELMALYAAFAQGKPTPLPPLRVQYADYASWQRSWLVGKVVDDQVAYWSSALRGAPPSLELPTDRPRPPVKRYKGSVVKLGFPAGMADRLRELGQREGATLFMVLLAGYSALLGRWSRQKDVVVGAPIANRTHADLAPLIGGFVNTLALRTSLEGDPSFRELIERVKETALGAYAHQDLPFERLVEELKVPRDTSRTPVFQTMFALHNVQIAELSLGSLDVSVEPTGQERSMFDLTLFMWERDGRLQGQIEYETDLFDQETIERLGEQLVRLLEGAASAPEASVARLPLIGEAELHRLTVEWNDTTRNVSEGRSVHELFEAQVDRTPEAVAVEFEGTTVTYRELDGRANRIARWLAKRGVGIGSRVGVSVERSANMVAALLGVMKAGAAYVPLDPSYPEDRRAYMRSDAKATVELDDGSVVEALTAESNLGRVGVRVRSEDVAYVIYTSGSTGRPKGVVVPHAGVVNELGSFRIAPGFEATDRVLSVTTLSFDPSVIELYLPLMLGGTVVLASREVASDGMLLARLIAESRPTVMQATPSTWRMLLANGWRPTKELRLLCGGEALTPDLAEVLASGAGALWNVYGPTETTVWATCVKVEVGQRITVGRMIHNMRAYVLDEWLQCAPMGVPGELCIGGAGMTHGYAGRPELTAGTFVPDAFSGEPGARLYRSGDLVRWLPDGQLEYLGRIDHQVKIRGHRIELGEIESVLAGSARLRESVVVALDDGSGSARLVAYVVGESGTTVDVEVLKKALSATLPDYMVPSAFVVMDVLPKTPSGKVDRKALPAPDFGATKTEYVAPRTETEAQIADAFAEVLRVARVGVDDDFFELGGHSLLATQLMSRLRERLGADLPLRALFEAPTVSGLATHVTRASGVRVETAPLARVSRSSALPLSFSELRFWFLEQYEPGTSTFNLPFGVRLHGALDVRSLEAALAVLIERHEALRTRFVAQGAEPVRQIDPPGEFRLVCETVDGSREPSRLMEEAHRPFDLAVGPLFRAILLRRSDEEHVLCIVMHHIVSDGWSFGVLMRELSTVYSALSEKRAPALPALSVEYADYASWERSHEHEERLASQLAHWKAHLASLPALELPTDRPRAAVRSPRGAIFDFELAAPLTAQLNALARREGSTLFMVLLSAFATMLSRHSGQRDFGVGTVVAHRTRVETEALVGLFINTLVMRADLSGDPSVSELLRRVREEMLSAHANQDLVFERLVEELRPARDTSRTPLFQVMFILQNVEVTLPSLGSLRSDIVRFGMDVSRCDLTLTCTERRGVVRGHLEYASELFDRETVMRMVSHLTSLLTGMVGEPAKGATRKVLSLPMLSEAERQTILLEWNATASPYAREKTLHDLFEEQVARTPDATAILFGGERLTYRSLNARANQLAHHLIGRGVGPDVRVGVYGDRTPAMVVALMAILKAGGAYVPLDMSYPADRLRYVLADSGARLVVSVTDAPVTVLETTVVRGDDEAVLREPQTNPSRRVRPAHLLAVVYTSGSTGRPKGVLETHGSFVNRLQWMWDAYPFDADEVGCLQTALGFVDSIWELYGPLLCGTPVLVVPDDLVRDVPALVQALNTAGVTRIMLVPSLMRAIMALDGDVAAQLPRLKHWLSSGEPLSTDMASMFASRFPGRQLFNMYGATEVSDATWDDVTARPLGSPIRIGKAISNTHCVVVDDAMQLVPVGVTGEIVVGGPAVARGYHGQPELTAQKFVPNPFSDIPGERLYRTGDLGRALPDGTLVCFGRVDHQVKIRGHRIELGEVESTLRRADGVRDGVVVARPHLDGGQWLVAYVVPETLDVDRLKEALRARLPDYMIPSAFVRLPVLPLTPNGKVDRRALPEPDRTTLGRDFVAPRTETERLIAGAFGEVLGLSEVGVDDDFFEIGGHSLLATRVVARLRAALEVDVPLRALFEASTVRALALSIGARAEEGAWSLEARAPLGRVARDGLLRASFAQERFWLLGQLDGGGAAYNVFLPRRLRGPLNRDALERSIQEIVRRHEVLRTTFTQSREGVCQVIHETADLRLAYVEATGADRAERDASAREEIRAAAQQPFDLAAGPVVRAKLVRIEDDEHLLVIAMHHIASDGWSHGILWRELTQLYLAFAAGEASPLKELPIQYADFAVWQRSWLTGTVLEKQLAYWTSSLRGAPPSLELPTDRPRLAMKSYRGARFTFKIPGVIERLNELAKREGATLFMVLLSAYSALLSRLSGQSDVVIGTPIANRTAVELEPLIGGFVNTLALRVSLQGQPTFRELVARAKEAALGAYAHQDLPFERLVEQLKPPRDTSRTPVFQTMFALQNVEHASMSLGELKVDHEPVSRDAAMFDITLFMWEQNGVLTGLIEYETDLFDRPTVERIGHQFRVLLDAVIAAPESPIARLPLMSEAERRQVLVEWNDTRAEYPRDVALHELIEAQAARTPKAVAVVSEAERLTYRELNARANGLAQRLRSSGVGPETLVGVCTERSPAQLVALLAVLKSGGAYVSLDPRASHERNASILAAAKVHVVLTDAAGAAVLPSAGPPHVRIGTEEPSETNLPRSGCAQNVAFVHFGAEKAGKPAGVEVTRLAAMNTLSSVGARTGFGSNDILLSAASLWSEHAETEVFLPLSKGGTVVMVAHEATRDAQTLLRLVERFGVTFLQATAPTWQALLDAGLSTSSGVRGLFCGEGLSLSLATQVRDATVDAWSLYGRGESTMAAAWRLPDDLTRVSVGEPLGNVRLYILDESHEPVPVGVVGELYIGGEGVARGYRDRPGLTAERFVPDPFSDSPGARLWSSGQFVRRQPNGVLTIEGARIPLGEIEGLLHTHPAVADVVVVNGVGQSRRLVAYYVAGGDGVTSEQLAGLLRTQMPVNMIPSAFVALPELPRSADGRVDRSALPDPDSGPDRNALSREYVAPRTETEEQIALIWREVLRLERVGVHDNFFELGGHSLLGTQLEARLSEVFDVQLSLRVIFEAPTVEEQSSRILEAQLGDLSPDILAAMLEGDESGA